MKPKGRPIKKRVILGNPRILQFSPRGKPGRPDEIDLTIEQYEAIRLADYKGLDQSQAAKSMGISRATFGRIIHRARHRLAQGFIDGKIIRII